MAQESPGYLKLKPSAIGFGRKYLLALTPLAILAVSRLLLSLARARYPTLPNWALEALAPLLTLVALILAWVLRSPEAAASSAFSLTLPLLLAFANGLQATIEAFRGYLNLYPYAALAASIMTLLAVEVRRRSYSYEIAQAGVTIKAGVWRRQEQTIPYTSIGRIVLEQSLLGRLFNYGTIIIVSPAEWGAEYYTRGIEASIGKGGVGAGVIYARTLKEVSRDPGKCLYGVRKPREAKETIESMLREVAGIGSKQAPREPRDRVAKPDGGS